MLDLKIKIKLFSKLHSIECKLYIKKKIASDVLKQKMNHVHDWLYNVKAHISFKE